MSRAKSKVLRVLIAVGAVLALVGGAASAAPARSTTLDTATQKFEWSDGPELFPMGTNATEPPVAMCEEPGFPCDETLIQLTEANGKLKIVTTADEGLPDGVRYRPDIDIYLYKSDANGTVGAEVARSETPERIETIQVNKAAAGYYLLRVAYWSGINVSYNGVATFTPPPPPA